MVTNHGIHEWEITAGLPDTGGQNVYVNELSGALAKLGFRVTIANRGGYPHPVSGTTRSGTVHRGDHERIVYLEDSSDAFVRKEDMFSQTHELGERLADRLLEEGGSPELVISHYWDGARVAEVARSRLPGAPTHVWIPHSLGKLKKQNTQSSDWDDLRIAERIDEEKAIVREVDHLVHTSAAMEQSLRDDYGVAASIFLPPGVDTERFEPDRARADRKALDLLAGLLPLDTAEIEEAPLVAEISRTVATKRKDVLIKAFAEVRRDVPDALLAVSIDEHAGELHDELVSLIEELGLRDAVAVLGSVWDFVPSLYAHSWVYCTPSVMEGFGMSIQEAAACRVATVASSRVPFAVEYLLGDDVQTEELDDGSELRVGTGTIVTPPDAIHATAQALIRLLRDRDLRERVAAGAYEITIPAFTWLEGARHLLQEVGVPTPDGSSARREPSR